MPRGRLAKLSDGDLAEYALKYHVDAFRRSKRSGINQVHHVQFGWMTMPEYYRLQKLHDLEPILGKLIEGGYRLKQAIYGFEIEILGTDIPVPVGAGLMATMFGKMALSIAEGHPEEALKWAAMLALPFGELAAVWILTLEALGLPSSIGEYLATFAETAPRPPPLPPVIGPPRRLLTP